MAFRFDKLRSFFGAPSQAQREIDAREIATRTLEQVRDEILVSVLDLKNDWKAEVGRRPDLEVDGLYEARVEQANIALAALQKVAASPDFLPARIDVAELRGAVYEDQSLGQLAAFLKDQNTLSKDLAQIAIELGFRPPDLAEEYRFALEDQYDVSPSASVEEIRTSAMHQTIHHYNDWDRSQAEFNLPSLRVLFAEEPTRNIGPNLSQAPADSLVEQLANQDKNMLDEWKQDLQSNLENQQEIDTYFAGRIDQFNSLIELAVTAHPELQETLPPQMNYEQLRSTLQQEIQQQNAPSVEHFGMAVQA
jgi:hypothetical protein